MLIVLLALGCSGEPMCAELDQCVLDLASLEGRRLKPRCAPVGIPEDTCHIHARPDRGCRVVFGRPCPDLEELRELEAAGGDVRLYPGEGFAVATLNWNPTGYPNARHHLAVFAFDWTNGKLEAFQAWGPDVECGSEFPLHSVTWSRESFLRGTEDSACDDWWD